MMLINIIIIKNNNITTIINKTKKLVGVRMWVCIELVEIRGHSQQNQWLRLLCYSFYTSSTWNEITYCTENGAIRARFVLLCFVL